MGRLRPNYKCVIYWSSNFLSNVTNPSRPRDSQAGFLRSFSLHQTKLMTRIKTWAVILVGKSAVPSHEVCRHKGQSHPWLVVCTSASYSIQQCWKEYNSGSTQADDHSKENPVEGIQNSRESQPTHFLVSASVLLWVTPKIHDTHEGPQISIELALNLITLIFSPTTLHFTSIEYLLPHLISPGNAITF